MIYLTSTTDKLQITTGSTLAISVHVSWIDLTSGATTPGRTNTAISSVVTASDIVAAPAASTQRSIKSVSIRNKDASASEAITVIHTDGTTAIELIKVTLLAGYSLQYDEGDGWTVIDANGSILQGASPGRLLKTTLLVSGTTFTTGAQTNSIKVRLVGGGGGGGGCTSVAADAAAAGGGGAGGYAEKLFAVTPNTAYTYAIGGAGAGNSGAGGGNGGDTTFAVGGTTVTAKGGTGAPVATAAAALTAYAGGAGGVVGTNGDVNASGMPGNYGVTLIVATPVVASGAGGSGEFGSGGLGLVAVGAGNAGTGNGSGGGGSATGAAAARAGGAGTVGAVVVEEYS